VSKLLLREFEEIVRSAVFARTTRRTL